MNSSRDQMHAIVRALPQFGWVGRVTGVHFSLILSLIGVKFFLQDMFFNAFDLIIIARFVKILIIC